MKNVIIMSGVVVVAVIAWRTSERLSDDALGIVLGLVFGVLAGIPASLIVLAAGRRKDREPDRAYPMQQPQLPPVILYGGNHQPYQQDQQFNQQPPALPLAVRHEKRNEIENADW